MPLHGKTNQKNEKPDRCEQGRAIKYDTIFYVTPCLKKFKRFFLIGLFSCRHYLINRRGMQYLHASSKVSKNYRFITFYLQLIVALYSQSPMLYKTRTVPVGSAGRNQFLKLHLLPHGSLRVCHQNRK